MNADVRRLGRRVLPLYEDIDTIWAPAVATRSSCRRGCHHCCYNLAAVSLEEAIPIAEYILTSDVWKPELPKIRTELARQVTILDGIGGVQAGRAMNETARKWLDKAIPCVFLKKNGDCGVYKVRPVVCRTYYVVSPPADCSPEKETTVSVLNAEEVVLCFWADAGISTLESLQGAVLKAMEMLESCG